MKKHGKLVVGAVALGAGLLGFQYAFDVCFGDGACATAAKRRAVTAAAGLGAVGLLLGGREGGTIGRGLMYGAVVPALMLFDTPGKFTEAKPASFPSAPRV